MGDEEVVVWNQVLEEGETSLSLQTLLCIFILKHMHASFHKHMHDGD